MFPTEAGRTDPEYCRDLPQHIFTPNEDDKALEIGIIGAGIAGLAAAAGLCRSGHGVEIFERSRFSNEVGAAINVMPNASRVLRYWGFDFQKANPSVLRQQRVMKGDDLEIKYFGDFSHWPKKYGAEPYLLHRVDLHNGMKELALEGNGTNVAKLNLSSEVVDLDCESGTLTLANGEKFQKDLIVVADGVHSPFVRKVVNCDPVAQSTGHSAFRFLIPTEKLVQSPETKALFENVPSGTFSIALLQDRRIVWYPCRSDELQNFVLIHKEVPGETYVEEWNVSAPLESLLKTCNGFHPDLVEMCKTAEDLKLWKLLFRSPIPSWTKGKAVLTGDAAHPMLPHQGQGGGQAIEDGAALGALLSHIQSLDDVPKRLQLFEQVRKKRGSAMQMFSNAGQEEAEKIEKDAQPFVDGAVPRTLEQFHDYNFGYNVFRECYRLL